MIYGTFRDGFPRIVLDLPTDSGFLAVEFIVDTGFDGDIALPSTLAQKIVSAPLFGSVREMADGRVVQCPVRTVTLEWLGTERTVEVIVLSKRALLGNGFFAHCTIEVRCSEGEDVVADCDA